MIGTDIVNRIAYLIRQQDIAPKDPKETKENKVRVEKSRTSDALELSKEAEAYTQNTVSTSEFEKEQKLKVERLKSLVSSGNYKMDPAMVDTIAERIANTLIPG